MEMIKNFLKEFSLTKMVFIILGLVFGFVPMLTETEAEYNWVFALIACAIMCAFLEAMRAVASKEKRYDWRNPVLALAATIVAIFICLLL
ncbi:hypothetical protein [Hoylesella shahii]|jgi:hypothetical protein|uniref:hypothetical protein n=1 Tax=Hoylesella shahii TaxID=228603 RepID=UPI0028EB0749|nr:hypothetical protein [Hoylesella shahii]